MGRSLLFYDQSFPYAGVRPSNEVFMNLSKQFTIVSANELKEHLDSSKFDCLIHLHGAYFPKECWSAILSFLKKGGNLLHIGGAPFKHPVYQENERWVVEQAQTTYHQKLLIHEALPVDVTGIKQHKHHRDIPLFEGKEHLFTIEPTYGFILHVTRHCDTPKEMGSAGPMDAHIYPLLKLVSDEGREVGAPAVLLEYTKGDFAGCRMMFINQPLQEQFWTNNGSEALIEWANYCAQGVTEVWLKSNYASYDAGDRPTITIQTQSLRRKDGLAPKEWTFDLTVRKKDAPNELEWKKTLQIETTNQFQRTRIPVPIHVEKGMYEVVCEARSQTGEKRIFKHGFWGFDDHLLKDGSPLSCDRDYFWKDQRPMPIVGMTYMTSDVARKFLFLPNPAVWDRDMAQMKKAGINFIRTGIWTGWRKIMFEDGHVHEEILRAIDAFILTAKKHELEVTFTFFAFTPENWEGANPYLDPRSVEAQKRFITTIVSKHKETTNVHWDLINEPSMFDPNRIFSGPRSAGDRFEKAAYCEWVKNRHGTIRNLQEKWNMTPDELPSFEAAVPPEPSEINFHIQDMGTEKKGTRWLDYSLFTIDMHNRWAAELTSAIKAINPNQLVTVGQDEGLAGGRPSPFFYEEVVDYTTVHSWWHMDALVWDGIFTKTPNKPNLVQETGIMYVETPDGRAKRSETELRNILERKYAYAFATGGAGAVQWIWNTNIYMDNINESNIGALRADGTEKPEANVSYDFGKFIEGIRDLFVGRELEDVAVIFPYSNDFSNRKVAYDATTTLTRILTYEMKVPFRALGEYHVDSLWTNPPKLLILPSAHNVSDQAFKKIVEAVKEKGITLLMTGPLGLNEYWQPTSRLIDELGQRTISNVVREEMLRLEGELLPVSFGASRIAELNKEVVMDENGHPSQVTNIHEIQIGTGSLIWCPLPIELNERKDTMRKMYDYALTKANIHRPLKWHVGGDLPGIYGRKMSFREGALFVFTSEYACDTEIEVTDTATNMTYSFTLESERSILFAADRSGRIVGTYRPNEVTIQSSPYVLA
ncbi:beta-galactosidase [Metabacillus sp. Hm71]|uniref:beta-galactosidase n=1 Tax=Metabacillus sp. Hm71 TaxID=3450743 RepID=UPI003F42F056